MKNIEKKLKAVEDLMSVAMRGNYNTGLDIFCYFVGHVDCIDLYIYDDARDYENDNDYTKRLFEIYFYIKSTTVTQIKKHTAKLKRFLKKHSK